MVTDSRIFCWDRAVDSKVLAGVDAKNTRKLVGNIFDEKEDVPRWSCIASWFDGGVPEGGTVEVNGGPGGYGSEDG